MAQLKRLIEFAHGQRAHQHRPVKVLLDENLDHALRTLLGRYEVVTAAYMGWAGLSNGELVRSAEDNGIEVLLTGDQSLSRAFGSEPHRDFC